MEQVVIFIKSNLQELNIISNIILTFGLFLFAWLQWLAMRNQNKIAFCQLRIKHYKQVMNGLYEIMKDLSKNSQINGMTGYEKVLDWKIRFADYADEAQYLFNKTFFENEGKVCNILSDMLDEMNKNKFILKSSMEMYQEKLFEIKNSIENDIQKFLK